MYKNRSAVGSMNNCSFRGIAGVFAGILAASLVAQAWADDEGLRQITARLDQGEPVRLAAIGDSITFVCFHSDFKRNYLTFTADALRRAYPKAQIELTIAGNLGTTSHALPKLNDSVLKYKPDIVFVMFGMNDCAAGPSFLDGYDANLTQYIRKIRDAGAVPIIATQNEIIDDAPGGRSPQLRAFMKRAIEVAQREKALSVDLFADWQQLRQENPETWKQYLNDGFHPNVGGHRLFASGILKRLWPEAARFHSAELRQPLSGPMQTLEPCLLGGPGEKHLLQIDPTTRVALTAGRRGGVPTDLLLWICRDKAEPQPADFQMIDLVGVGSDPVFVSHETPINSGLMLPGKDGSLHILFTQTVGVYMLTIDTTRPEWWNKLSERASYRIIQPGSLPLPEVTRGSYQADCELIDGRLDANGRPEYLLRDVLLASDGSFQESGIIRERYHEPTKEYVRTMVLPGCKTANVAKLGDGTWCLAGQDERTDHKGVVFKTVSMEP